MQSTDEEGIIEVFQDGRRVGECRVARNDCSWTRFYLEFQTAKAFTPSKLLGEIHQGSPSPSLRSTPVSFMSKHDETLTVSGRSLHRPHASASTCKLPETPWRRMSASPYGLAISVAKQTSATMSYHRNRHPLQIESVLPVGSLRYSTNPHIGMSSRHGLGMARPAD